MSQSIKVFKGAKHVEVADRLGELALFHHGADEDRWNLIVAGVVILVPGNDQKAIVSLRKLDVPVQVLFEPGITLRDRAVMHIVVEIRNDESERGQCVEVSRETRERLVGGCGHVGEIDPGRMFLRIGSGGTHCGT